MENCAILRKGLGRSRGLWLLLQKYHQQSSRGPRELRVPAFWALGPTPVLNVPPRDRAGERGRTPAQGDRAPLF